jgi:endonuclease/exonuclease/phosphatase family metal-dependent hydrolase
VGSRKGQRTHIAELSPEFPAVKAGIDRIRVVTYNVHKCRGLDRRVRPERIVEVLREIDADIIALQEVLSADGSQREENQAGYIAGALGLKSCLGENRRLNGGAYGNLLLSRYLPRAAFNYNISRNGRERRGCLRVDLEAAGAILLHVFNVHLGTAFLERRDQGRKLVSSQILNNGELQGARIVLGDFNEWTRGLATRLLSAQFESVDVQRYLRRSRTYPGILPLLHLDHIYFDRVLKLESLALHRSRAALIASDHLPLVADFRMPTVP